METRALVFGATGYTGHHIVQRLTADSIATVAHVRADSPRGEEWEGRFRSYGAEISRASWEASEITSLVKDAAPTWIFALLGTTRARKKDLVARGEDGAQETYEAIDRDLTLMALEAAAGLDSRPLFVYLSSLGADVSARLPYLKVRGEVERRIAESALPYVIAQPGFITGADRPESRPMERVGAALSDGALSALAAVGLRGPHAKWASMSGDQLAAGLIAAARDAGSESSTTLEPPALRQLAAG